MLITDVGVLDLMGEISETKWQRGAYTQWLPRLMASHDSTGFLLPSALRIVHPRPSMRDIQMRVLVNDQKNKPPKFYVYGGDHHGRVHTRQLIRAQQQDYSCHLNRSVVLFFQ